MGDPLSPFLAEIFMDNLEKEIHRSKFSNNIKFWVRYVDDILICFNGSNRQLDLFVTYINNIHDNINFTIERESERQINFLDLTLIRTIDNNFEFKIFHKPSHTDMIIHETSAHPHSHKLAAFHSYIHRLFSVPLSDENFQKELNIIKQIAVNNGYQVHLIDTLIRKKREKTLWKKCYPVYSQPQKFCTVTFYDKYSLSIAKYLEKALDTKVSFRTENKLGSFLKNNKSKIKPENKSGVYLLECGSCDKIYIGQTGRAFHIRIGDHTKNYEKKKEKSNYAFHLVEENHIVNDKFKTLHVCDKGKKLDFLESMEINRYKNKGILLNDQKDLNSSPLLNLFLEN